MGQGQSASGIQQEFFELFSKNFFTQCEKYGDLISCFDEKNFTERQSYSLVVASLMDMGKHVNNIVDFVLTEVGMVRNGEGEDKKSSGRVDYLIGFGRCLFLIELKLEFVRLGKSANVPKNCVPKNCANAWDAKASGVVRQLRLIDEKMNPVLQEIIGRRNYHNMVVKLPMLIVMYASDSSEKNLKEKEEKKTGLGIRHRAIAGQLKCTFNQFYLLANTSTRYHTRRNNSPTPCYRTTFGVGIMAGAEEFQKPIA